MEWAGTEGFQQVTQKAEEICAVAKARDRAPLCVTAAWGNKEEERWLVHQYYLVGQLRLPEEQPPGRGSHDACSPSPAWLLALGPLWLVLPRSSSLPQTTLRPGEEQTRKL